VGELLKVQMLSYFITIVYLFSFDLDLYKYRIPANITSSRYTSHQSIANPIKNKCNLSNRKTKLRIIRYWLILEKYSYVPPLSSFIFFQLVVSFLWSTTSIHNSSTKLSLISSGSYVIIISRFVLPI